MEIKILIIDDNRMNCRLLKEILEDEGFTVEICNESVLSIKYANTFKPDIILLDIMMPEMDGFEVCKLLKSNSVLMHIPVIMVTAKTDSADLKKALEIGAFDYIRKPVDDIEVIARINSAYKYKKINDQLREMAMKDGLTGIYNHTLLVELFEKEAARCRRMNENTAFLMIDVDFFKVINDTYGHLAGDAILRELAETISKSVRVNDIVGRYGGEEFGVVLSGLTEIDTIKVCEKIRRNIDEKQFKYDDISIKITVSIGFCLRRPEDASNINENIRKADEALYNAKKMGRNRVEVSI